MQGTTGGNRQAAATTLMIVGPDGTRRLEPDPDGVLIGRSAACNIVLDAESISREHARLYRDPFDRWVIEDIDSRNGTWIGNRRVQVQAVASGESITIGPFLLQLNSPRPQRTRRDTVLDVRTSLYDGSDAGVHTRSPLSATQLSLTSLKRLDEVMDRLAGLSEVEEVYPETCRCLAAMSAMAAMVVRLPAGDGPLPQSPAVQACSLCNGGGRAQTRNPTDLHLSRRVLEAVRGSGQPAMASDLDSGESQMKLTVVDAQAPRSVFCSQVVATDDHLDLLYVDTPALTADGDMLDFVHVLSHQVQFAQSSLQAAADRADRVALDRQLAMAREIQDRLTPSEFSGVPGVQTALCYRPALWVGGDYCDVWLQPDGRMGLAVGDVCGKGLPAAMVMANLQATLRTAVAFGSDLGEAMQYVGRHLEDHFPDGIFVTLVVALLDGRTGQLEYVNAGHVLPLVTDGCGSVRPLGKPTFPPLGVTETEYRGDRECLSVGHTVLLVTDGITETVSPDGRMFDVDHLGTLLAGTGPQRPQELVDGVAHAATAFRGHLAQGDDMTILAVQRLGADA